MGIMDVRITIPGGQHLVITVHVVDAYIPMLTGMGVLYARRLVQDFGNEVVSGSDGRWKLPMTRKLGHIFLTWNKRDIFYSEHELRRLHLHFMQTSADRLFSLVKMSRPLEAGGGLRATIKAITETCRSCREFSKRPFRFRASVPPDRVNFNHEIAMDLLWLDGRPILHIFDTHTHFHNAMAITSKRAEDVWYAFVEGWASVYVGYPNVIRLDQESSFKSDYFRISADAHVIELQFSGIESHNSIGTGERYHAPLRRLFRILRTWLPSLNPEIALRYAIKGLNDTMGRRGLSLL